MDSVKSLRLRYFPYSGRAGAIRDALKMGKVVFEDVFVPFEEFEERRAKGEFSLGALPVLDIETNNGKFSAAQSNAILRLAGRLANLYPVDDMLRALKVDEAMDFGEDIYQAIEPSLLEKNVEKKMAMRETLASKTLPDFAQHFDGLLLSNGKTGFVFGDTLTVGDLKLYWIFDWLSSGILDGIPTDLFDGYQNITAWRSNIAAVRKAHLE